MNMLLHCRWGSHTIMPSKSLIFNTSINIRQNSLFQKSNIR
jgi:hypothetical protein